MVASRVASSIQYHHVKSVEIISVVMQSRSQGGAEYAQHAQNITERTRGITDADWKLYYFTIYMFK